MKKTLYTTLAILIMAFAAVVAYAALFTLQGVETVESATPDGIAAVATSATTTQVGPDDNVLVSDSEPCSARVVSTQDQSIMLIFEDFTNGDVSSTTLDANTGHQQGASTTVAYDASVYGCGQMYGYAAASTTITVTETR